VLLQPLQEFVKVEQTIPADDGRDAEFDTLSVNLTDTSGIKALG
jgi:hypothetical protein